MANFTGAATGGISGATTGATIGGVPGAIIGGIAGAAGGLFGKKKRRKKISTLDKRQQAINEQQYAGFQGEGPFADLYNYNPEKLNEAFDKTIANPAYRNFREKLAPEITGQFRSQGLMQSSYAGDALSRVARDVQEKLDAERSKYQYKASESARAAKQAGLENYQNRKTFGYDKSAGANASDIDQILASISPQAAESLGSYFNKPKQPAPTGGTP